MGVLDLETSFGSCGRSAAGHQKMKYVMKNMENVVEEYFVDSLLATILCLLLVNERR
jgi:hypothetical protein